MKAAERAWRIGRDFGGRAAAGARRGGGTPVTGTRCRCTGVRQLGEVVLDELALTGMTLTAPPPKLERSVESCAAAAQELSGRGVAGAHAEPDPLQVKSVRRRRFGRQTYEQLTLRPRSARCRNR